MKKRILIVAGTRPEIIKLSPIIYQARKNKELDVKVCVTAQHREMMDQMLNLFDIKVEYDLDVMKINQGLNSLCATILSKIDSVLLDFMPDWVIVQGDTTSAMAAALASFYRKIKVIHVEAGLRSGNVNEPYPEEVNRKIISAMATFHCAPTSRNKEDLVKEGVDGSSIFVTGNTVVDAVKYAVIKIENNAKKKNQYKTKFDYMDFSKKIILVTGHRRENFGERNLEILKSLRVIAKNNEVELIYPVHFNPEVRNVVHEMLGGCENIHLIEPVDYFSMIYLLMNCYLVITDSGGIQEEAPSFSKPVLVTRLLTERREALEIRAAKLVELDVLSITGEVQMLLDDSEYYKSFCVKENPFGAGDSAKKILKLIE